jgi:hypothetical protein
MGHLWKFKLSHSSSKLRKPALLSVIDRVTNFEQCGLATDSKLIHLRPVQSRRLTDQPTEARQIFNCAAANNLIHQPLHALITFALTHSSIFAAVIIITAHTAGMASHTSRIRLAASPYPRKTKQNNQQSPLVCTLHCLISNAFDLRAYLLIAACLCEFAYLPFGTLCIKRDTHVCACGRNFQRRMCMGSAPQNAL